MKLLIDRHNKTIVAKGYYKGHSVRGLSRCKEDVWDEAVGTEIAKRRYGIRLAQTKQKLHAQNIRALHRQALWCFKQIEAEDGIVSALGTKISGMEGDLNKFLQENVK